MSEWDIFIHCSLNNKTTYLTISDKSMCVCVCILNFDQNTVLYFPLFVQMCNSGLLCKHINVVYHVCTVVECHISIVPLFLQNYACNLAVESNDKHNCELHHSVARGAVFEYGFVFSHQASERPNKPI